MAALKEIREEREQFTCDKLSVPQGVQRPQRPAYLPASRRGQFLKSHEFLIPDIRQLQHRVSSFRFLANFKIQNSELKVIARKWYKDMQMSYRLILDLADVFMSGHRKQKVRVITHRRSVLNPRVAQRMNLMTQSTLKAPRNKSHLVN